MYNKVALPKTQRYEKDCNDYVDGIDDASSFKCSE